MWMWYLVTALSLICCADSRPSSDVGFPVTVSPEAGISEAQGRNIMGQEVELIMALNIDAGWEEFLFPGPLTVALIGQLIVLGNQKDFKFSQNVSTYKYIRHQYFQPTMIQISNGAWEAFHNAHSNMNQIRLHMLSIPTNVKMSLKFLSTGSAEVVKRFLPIPLNAISKAGRECVRLARETDKKFVDIMLLLNEVDEVVSATKSATDSKLDELKIQIEQTKVEKEQIEKLQDFTKKEFDKVSAQLSDDRRQYEEALRKIPTGWKVVFMEMVRQINPLDLMKSFQGGFTKLGRKVSASGDGEETDDGLADKATHFIQDQVVLNIAGNFYNSFLKMADQVDEWIKEIGPGTNMTEDEASNSGDIEKYLKSLGVGLRTVKGSLEGKSSKFIEKVTQLLDGGLTIVQDLQEKVQSGAKLTLEILQETKTTLDTLISDAKELVAVKNSLTGGSIRQTTAPSTSGSVGANERYKAAMRQQTLHLTAQRYDMYYNQMMQVNREMTQLLVRLSNFDLSRASYEEIRRVIQQGIAAIAKLKEQWNQLIRFFEIISSVANVTMKNTVEQFFQLVEQGGQMVSKLGDDALQPVRDELAEEAVRLATVSRFIYTLSDTYVNVSNMCIMGRLAGISKLQAIDDTSEQKAILRELFDGSQTAQAKIAELATAKKESFKMQVESQKQDIKRIYHIVGSPTADDKRALKAAEETLKDYKLTTNKSKFLCPMCQNA